MGEKQDTSRKPRRRWFQFSLRTLLLFVLATSLPLAWLGVKAEQAREHRQAVAEIRRIESLGGIVEWDVFYGSIDSERYYPTWLEKLFGDPGIPDVSSVVLADFKFDDDGMMVLLKGFNFDDDGVVLLKGMTELKSLNLGGSKVTDAGLVHLKALTNLGWLELGNMQVTDAGLVQGDCTKSHLPHRTCSR